MSERDIVERLQEGRVSQTCRHCDLGKPGSDSVIYVRCGRGDCLAEHEDRHEAAAEILRLRAELAARAVPDEEVVVMMAFAAMKYDFRDQPEQFQNIVWGKEGGRRCELMTAAVETLRAAGFTVIRTEARDER